MVRWVVGSIPHGGASQCSTTGVTKAVVSAILSVGWCLCGGSGFSLSLSEWSFTICPTPYNRK